METKRPTPETDALEASLVASSRTKRYYEALRLSRKLEMERDEALAALSTPPPAMVPLEDVRPLVEALETCACLPKATMYPDGPCLDCEDYKEVHDALATFAAKYQL